jgi:quinol-cytochrome oxidoreductase complex cytochrome b subunit
MKVAWVYLIAILMTAFFAFVPTLDGGKMNAIGRRAFVCVIVLMVVHAIVGSIVGRRHKARASHSSTVDISEGNTHG